MENNSKKNIQKNEKKNHWSWLQDIRGFAALLVLIIHSWLYFKSQFDVSSEFLDFITIDYFDIGKIGVVIFFLISGYLLPYSLEKKSKKDFVVNRFFRLYPTYWFSIILALLLVGGYSTIQTLANLTMLQKFIGISDMVGAFWTMPLELVFYAFCLIFISYLRNENFLFKSFVVVLFIALLTSFLRYYYQIRLPIALFLILSVSLLGYIIRLFNEKIINIGTLKKYFLIFFITLIPITILAYDVNLGRETSWFRYYNSYTIGIVIFLIVALTKLKISLFSFLGKISYSLYLTHGVIIAAFSNLFLIKDNISLSIGLYFSVIFTTAIITYYLVEIPTFKVYYLIKSGKKYARS